MVDETETVEVLGVVFPKDDLARALDAYDELGHLANYGNVVVVDDEFIDSDVAVFNLDTGDYTHASPDEIREALDSEQSFADYVRDNVSMASHEHVIESLSFDATVVDDHNQWLSCGTLANIQGTDGITIAEIEYTHEKDELQVSLEDTREE
jgi:hypothetical protein